MSASPISLAPSLPLQFSLYPSLPISLFLSLSISLCFSSAKVRCVCRVCCSVLHLQTDRHAVRRRRHRRCCVQGEGRPGVRGVRQGLTLVHFSAQRKRFLWIGGCT